MTLVHGRPAGPLVQDLVGSESAPKNLQAIF
jgi:hypothetical protein